MVNERDPLLKGFINVTESVEMNRTTSAPKSVLRYHVDKGRNPGLVFWLHPVSFPK